MKKYIKTVIPAYDQSDFDNAMCSQTANAMCIAGLESRGYDLTSVNNGEELQTTQTAQEIIDELNTYDPGAIAALVQYAYGRGYQHFKLKSLNNPSIDDIKKTVDRDLICRILSTIYGSTGSHAVVLVGYDIENNQYAVHTTWSSNESKSVIWKDFTEVENDVWSVNDLHIMLPYGGGFGAGNGFLGNGGEDELRLSNVIHGNYYIGSPKYLKIYDMKTNQYINYNGNKWIHEDNIDEIDLDLYNGNELYLKGGYSEYGETEGAKTKFKYNGEHNHTNAFRVFGGSASVPCNLTVDLSYAMGIKHGGVDYIKFESEGPGHFTNYTQGEYIPRSEFYGIDYVVGDTPNRNHKIGIKTGSRNEKSSEWGHFSLKTINENIDLKMVDVI